MSPSNRKKLWLSVAAVVICVAAITVTLVLTLRGNDDSHVKIEPPDDGVEPIIGKLDVSLIRERLQTVTINKEGLPSLRIEDKFVDFSKSGENIFGIGEDVIIGPGCYFEASMAISNTEQYAFEYWLEITPQDGDNLLVDQLELTIQVDGEAFAKRTLSQGLITEPLSSVKTLETSRFTVRLEYLDTDNNNQTQNTTLAFDMIVHARLIRT